MSKPERPITIGEELGQFLESHQSSQEGFGDAFAETLPQRSKGEELRDAQLRTASEINLIRRDLQRMSHQLLISNIITTSLFVVFGAALAFSSFLAFRGASSSDRELDSDQLVEGRAAAEAPSESLSSLPLVAMREPLSPDDTAIYPLVFDLYLRARRFHQTNPSGSGSALTARREGYLQFLTDAAKLVERAAEKNVSQDLLQVIVKITELAKQHYQHIGIEQPQTINLDNEIRVVLRQYAPTDDRRLNPRRM